MILCYTLSMETVDLLSTADAAAQLGVTVQRVNAMIRDGRLHATKISGVWLIRPADLEMVRHRKTGRPKKEATTTQ